jgi:hypothetical protein
MTPDEVDAMWVRINKAWDEQAAKPFYDPGPSWEEQALIKIILDVVFCAEDWIVFYKALPPKNFRTEPLIEIIHFLLDSMKWFARVRTGWYADATKRREELDFDMFENWLIDKWLTQVQSAEFRDSAEYHYLRAEWERQR